MSYESLQQAKDLIYDLGLNKKLCDADLYNLELRMAEALDDIWYEGVRAARQVRPVSTKEFVENLRNGQV